VWNAVYGPTVAGHAAQAARPSIPSCAKTLIARAAAQAKCAKLNGDYSCTEASVEAFLKHEMFSGGSLPKFEKSKGKKPTSVNHFAATSSTAASAVDLVDEDDDHLDKHAANDGHVREVAVLHRENKIHQLLENLEVSQEKIEASDGHPSARHLQPVVQDTEF